MAIRAKWLHVFGVLSKVSLETAQIGTDGLCRAPRSHLSQFRSILICFKESSTNQLGALFENKRNTNIAAHRPCHTEPTNAITIYLSNTRAQTHPGLSKSELVTNSSSLHELVTSDLCRGQSSSVTGFVYQSSQKFFSIR